MISEKSAAETRIKKLKNLILDLNYKYFVLGEHILDEAVRDSLKRELIELETKYPEFITKDSPTQRVGSVLSGRFPKVKHSVKKQSLSDVFDESEIIKWEERIKKITLDEIEYVTELKIDGLNITIKYVDGLFERALTRGDGKTGEDVSNNVRAISSIPLKLNEKINIEVSGEVFLPKKSFDKLNKIQEKNGEKPFANTRNAASGTMRQLDPNIVSSRGLDMFFYQIEKNEGKKIKTQSESLKFLKKIGLKICDLYETHTKIEGVLEFCKKWGNKRNDLGYDIDGVVIKVNNKKTQEEIGYTAKAPKFAVAYKFPAEQSSSQILDIVMQVGRTGAVTPVAIMKPTFIAGSLVSRATLHNKDEIVRKDVRIGDTVIIQKAGDIIPEVVEVLIEMRDGTQKPFEFLETCPECGEQLIRNEGEAVFRCYNKDCPAVKKQSLSHFVSKKGFNIDGLGEKVVQQLFDAGVINTFKDIFTIKEYDLYTLPKFKEKRVKNALNSIEKSKNIELEHLLFALGIRHLGEQSSLDFAKFIYSHRKKADMKIERYNDRISELNQFSMFEEEKKIVDEEDFSLIDLIFTVENLTIENIQNIENIGEKIGASIFKYFNNKENKQNLVELYKLGIKLKTSNLKNNTRGKFSGENVVITGSFKGVSRDKIKKYVRDEGGKIQSSISKTTTILIAGEKAGSKLKKAKDLGVKIINDYLSY